MKLILIFLIASTMAYGCAVSGQTQKSASGEAQKFRAAADYSRSTRGLSVLVIKGNKIVFEEYHNGHAANKPWMLASGTKSFSGVMLAAAIEDKLIKSFDEKVSDTISEWKSDPRKAKITVRQLLSLTGGIDAGPIARAPTYSASLKMSATHEPGEVFQYGPAAFQVFGELMRRKLQSRNETVLDYLKRRIFEPIGMKVGDWTLQEGQPDLPSGAFLTAREWAKFGQFLKDGGRAGGKQVVGKKLLDELYEGSQPNPNYGLTFWLNLSNDASANIVEPDRRPLREWLGNGETGISAMSKNGIGKDIATDLFMAAGAGNQRLYVIPSMDLVIVRQGRMARFDDREFLSRLLPALSEK